MSPTLLSQRLKELEAAGVIERKRVPSEKDVFDYHLTQAGRELVGVVEALGSWGQKWVGTDASLKHLVRSTFAGPTQALRSIYMSRQTCGP